MKFAIIGCGKIANKHAAHIAARGKLLAVCDLVKEKADSLAATYGATAYYALEDMLRHEKELDIVAVCTPNGLHAAHCIACLDAGFHVLCEKPMAIRIDDCEQMIAAAERAGKILAVVKQNRFNPAVVAVKQLLDAKAFGKMFSIHVNCFWNRNADYYTNSNWRGTREFDGGVLFTQFSHFIDILYWFAGELQESNAILCNYNHKDIIEFEDTGSVILHFKNGVVGSINYTINAFDKNLEGSVTIFGELGSVKIGGTYLNTIEYQSFSAHVIPEIESVIQPNYYGSYQGSMSNHDKVYDNLMQVINKQNTLSASAKDGIKTVEMISQIYKCAEWIGVDNNALKKVSETA